MKTATARHVRQLRDGRRIVLTQCPHCQRDAYTVPTGRLCQCPSCSAYFELDGVQPSKGPMTNDR